MKKIFRNTLALALLGGIALLYLWPDAATPVFLTTHVRYQDMVKAVQASGTLHPLKQVDVGAQVNGQVMRLLVEEGDRVKQGDLLAEIDATVAKNNLRKMEAEQVKAKSLLRIKHTQLRRNKLTLARQRQMFKDGSTSQDAIDKAESDVEVSDADVTYAEMDIMMAEIAVATARTELGYNRIVAPMDGTILSLVTKMGQTLVSSQVVPTLLKLADIDTMLMKVQISEVDMLGVQIGMPVSFSLIGDPTTHYSSTLSSIQLAPTDAYEDSKSAVYYYALIEVPNPDHTLRVGMSTHVSIIQARRSQVLTIPVTALSVNGPPQSTTVFVIENGQKVPRTITLGLRNEAVVEVITGLHEGDVVVTSGEPVAVDDDGMILL